MVKNARYIDIDVTGFPTLPRSLPCPPRRWMMPTTVAAAAALARFGARARIGPPHRRPDPSRPAVEGPLPCHA